MRSTLRAALVALGLAGGASLLAGQTAPVAAAVPAVPKLAYINSQAILAQAPGRADAEAQFEREMAGYRSTVQLLGDSLNKLVADYNKQEITLSPAAKEARQRTLRTKEEAYQSRVRQLEQQAQQKQAELVQPIMDRIKQVIDQLRTEEGYTIIFDATAQGGGIVAADKNLDITDRVLARLRTIAAAPRSDSTRGPARQGGAPAAAPAAVARPRPPGR